MEKHVSFKSDDLLLDIITHIVPNRCTLLSKDTYKNAMKKEGEGGQQINKVTIFGRVTSFYDHLYEKKSRKFYI